MLNKIMVSGRKLKISTAHYPPQSAFVYLVLETCGRLIHASEPFYQLTGYSPSEIAAQPLLRVPSENDVPSLSTAINRAKERNDNWQGELPQLTKKGEIIWLDVRLTAQRDEKGEIFAFVVWGVDITRHIALRERLHFRAHNDVLTRILNRQGYYIRSRKKIRSAQAIGAKTVVAVLDLDKFKSINDRLGHAAGDEVLRCFVNRVKQSISHDTVFGRLGGDEFALTYVKGVDDGPEKEVLQAIVEKMHIPVYLRQHQEIVHLSVSIGAAIYPEHGRHFSTVLKAADDALYIAKRRGGNSISHYQVRHLI